LLFSQVSIMASERLGSLLRSSLYSPQFEPRCRRNFKIRAKQDHKIQENNCDSPSQNESGVTREEQSLGSRDGSYELQMARNRRCVTVDGWYR